MSKQSSIEWLVNCITEDHMIKAKSLNEWHNIFEKAKQMHKEEIVEAYRNGRTDQQSGIDKWYNRSSSGYYQETYGGSPKTSDN